MAVEPTNCRVDVVYAVCFASSFLVAMLFITADVVANSHAGWHNLHAQVDISSQVLDIHICRIKSSRYCLGQLLLQAQCPTDVR